MMGAELNGEQAALLASIMSKSSQNFSVVQPAVVTQSAPQSDNSNRLLSQAEIDALIASMTG